jgi:micrococcal nuclease
MQATEQVMRYFLRYFLRMLVRDLLSAFAWITSRPKRPPDHAEQPQSPPWETRTALGEAETRGLIATFPEARVLNVADGDTCTVEYCGHSYRIRLDSIDCPEGGQDWGKKAKYGLIDLAGGQRVRLEIHGLDDYQRTLATLYVRQDQNQNWINVNERMVMLGHAWVMDRYYGHLPPDRQAKLHKLEQWARSRNVGLWRAPNPTPPWNWRKANSEGQRR